MTRTVEGSESGAVLARRHGLSRRAAGVIGASTAVLVNTLVARPVESLAGLGITLLGVPVCFSWQRRADQRHLERPEAP